MTPITKIAADKGATARVALYDITNPQLTTLERALLMEEALKFYATARNWYDRALAEEPS